MERVVGIFFFGLIISGLGLLLYAKSNANPETRRKWSSFGLAVGAFGLFFFGSVSLLYIRFSVRPTLSGSISRLVQHHGKYPSSDFHLITMKGDDVPIRADYSGPGLIENEQATIKFVQYNHALVDLTMLTGPYQGWHLKESDGSLSCWLLLLMGLAGFWAARNEWLKDLDKSMAPPKI